MQLPRPCFSSSSSSSLLRDIMVSHKEFTTAGKKPGLQVWRIENLDLKPVPEHLQGSFFTGDAYLLLFTTSAPSYCIHMWIGRTPPPQCRAHPCIHIDSLFCSAAHNAHVFMLHIYLKC